MASVFRRFPSDDIDLEPSAGEDDIGQSLVNQSTYENKALVMDDFWEAPAGTTYYGTLKRYNGATWVKEPLKRYNGSWVTATLKRYNGAAWVQVDTTGV
jgi:hypothetical protein